jgi:hypothetical protein
MLVVSGGGAMIGSGFFYPLFEIHNGYIKVRHEFVI